MTARVLLEGGIVLSPDRPELCGPQDLLIEDGRIAAMAQPGQLRHRAARAERVSCRNRILLPGLVNAHLHPDLHILKGALEGLTLQQWGTGEHFQRALDLMSGERGASWRDISVRASLAECALGGVTTVATYGVTDGADVSCAATIRSLGLRGSTTVRDAAFRPAAAVPAVTLPVPALYRLHAEETLDEEELALAARAYQRGEWLVMHAAETEARVQLARRRFGMTTIRLLDHWKVLGPRTLLSHAVHIDAEELALIAASGAAVVVSPSAELKLGDGVAPVVELLHRGVTVALGTDAAVCNNGSDMFLEMRQLGLSRKLRHGPAALPAEQILLTATRHGARLLPGGEQRGLVREGWDADLIAVDTNNPRVQPLVHNGRWANAAANLVYAATAQDVTDVMVGGRWIVRRRRLLTQSTRGLWRALNGAARQLHAQIDR